MCNLILCLLVSTPLSVILSVIHDFLPDSLNAGWVLFLPQHIWIIIFFDVVIQIRNDKIVSISVSRMAQPCSPCYCEIVLIKSFPKNEQTNDHAGKIIYIRSIPINCKGLYTCKSWQRYFETSLLSSATFEKIKTRVEKIVELYWVFVANYIPVCMIVPE